MAIRIIEEPTVHVTAGDLARYKADYIRDHSMYCGPMPTLEEYIRRRQAEAKGENVGQLPWHIS
jgi:hypothetical protein